MSSSHFGVLTVRSQLRLSLQAELHGFLFCWVLSLKQLTGEYLFGNDESSSTACWQLKLCLETSIENRANQEQSNADQLITGNSDDSDLWAAEK